MRTYCKIKEWIYEGAICAESLCKGWIHESAPWIHDLRNRMNVLVKMWIPR